MKYQHILIIADDSPSEIKAVLYGFDLAAQLKAKEADGIEFYHHFHIIYLRNQI